MARRFRSSYSSWVPSSRSTPVVSNLLGRSAMPPLSPDSFHRQIKDVISGPNNAVSGRNVRIVTPSDEESSESNNALVKANTLKNTGTPRSDRLSQKKKRGKATKRKAKAAKADSSTDDESSSQAEEASTDADSSSVVSSVACIKDPNWSLSEDCRLLSMKEAGESLTFASNSLCKPTSAVLARWKVLKTQNIPSAETTDAESGDASTEGDSGADGSGTDGESESEESSSDEESESEESSSDEQSEDTKIKTKGKGKGKAISHTKRPGNKKGHKGGRNNKVSVENKQAKARAKAKTSKKCESSTESGEEGSDESSQSSTRLVYRGSEKEKEMKYLHDHIYKAMYTPEIKLRPDALLSKRDCALIETFDSRHKQTRWLEMQANFYNATGRMVPLEVFKTRCEQAEAEKEKQSDAWKLSKRISKVEKWIANQEVEKWMSNHECEDSED